jgi:hypothetical protein
MVPMHKNSLAVLHTLSLTAHIQAHSYQHNGTDMLLGNGNGTTKMAQVSASVLYLQ